jgi:hypothetical protein
MEELSLTLARINMLTKQEQSNVLSEQRNKNSTLFELFPLILTKLDI